METFKDFWYNEQRSSQRGPDLYREVLLNRNASFVDPAGMLEHLFPFLEERGLADTSYQFYKVVCRIENYSSNFVDRAACRNAEKSI